jgi:hypothetical protein
MAGMPEFLTPDRFVLELVDGQPTVTLPDVEVSTADGWSFLNRTTLLVIDGPGDEGFLLPRMVKPDSDAAPSGWDSAVERTGSVAVNASATQFQAVLID